MDITCSKCGTEYALDDTLISKSGTKVRCMTCDHVFKVYRGQDKESDQWVLRQTHGPIRTFTRMALLQEWIRQGKVTMDDLISRKNGPWKKIGDIAELRALFGQVQSKAGRQPPAPPGIPRKVQNREPTQRRGLPEPNPTPPKRAASERPTLPPPPSPSREAFTSDAPTPLATLKEPPTEKRAAKNDASVAETRTAATEAAVSVESPGASAPRDREGEGSELDLSRIPALTDEAGWEAGGDMAVSEPAWTETSKNLQPYVGGLESMPPPRRQVGRWIILGVAGAIGVSLLIGLVAFPQVGEGVGAVFDDMVSTPKPDRFKRFFDRGQESLLMDSSAAFLQADREFQKVLALEEDHPGALAALAQLFSIWAQYLRDAELDAMADGIHSEAAAATRETDRLHREFEEKLAEASAWAERALKANPAGRSALLARADILRMRGELEAAADHLKKASAIQFDAETEYVSVLLDIEKGDPSEGLISRLTDLGNKPLPRAIYRQARLLAAAGEKERATQALDHLLGLNPEHEWARVLLDRLKKDKPVLITAQDIEALQRESERPDEGVERKPRRREGDLASGRAGDGSEDPETRGVSGLLLKAKRLLNKGRLEDAKAQYDRVLENSPSNLDALSGVGYYFLKKGQPGRAITHFRRCMLVSPNYGPAIIGLAETYKAMGQTAEALKHYRSYLQTNPTGSQAETARHNVSRLAASSAALEPDSPGGAEPAPDEPAETGTAPSGDLPNTSPSADPEPEPSPAEPAPPAGTTAPAASSDGEVIIIDKEASNTELE